MINRLKGKTAIVTGATAGIGRAIAENLAEMGVHIHLTGRRKERLSELRLELEQRSPEISITSHTFDVQDREQCKTFVDVLGKEPIDILINNAGLAAGLDGVQSADIDDWETMIDTNVKGLLYLTRFILPSMIERKEGYVLNIGSIAGHEAYAGGSVYSGTKHAVQAITKATKMDVHGTPIRVGMVSPGLVETEFSMVRFKGDEQRASGVYAGIEPLTANDIAEIVVFMLNRPPHVNILDTIVYPVAQSAATMVARSNA